MYFNLMNFLVVGCIWQLTCILNTQIQIFFVFKYKILAKYLKCVFKILVFQILYNSGHNNRHRTTTDNSGNVNTMTDSVLCDGLCYVLHVLQITLLLHPIVSTCATMTAQWNMIRIFVYVTQLDVGPIQGSHASWKVLDFFLKFAGPGKS